MQLQSRAENEIARPRLRSEAGVRVELLLVRPPLREYRKTAFTTCSPRVLIAEASHKPVAGMFDKFRRGLSVQFSQHSRTLRLMDFRSLKACTFRHRYSAKMRKDLVHFIPAEGCCECLFPAVEPSA